MIKGTGEHTLLATLQNNMLSFWYETHTHSERLIFCYRFWWFSASMTMYAEFFEAVKSHVMRDCFALCPVPIRILSVTHHTELRTEMFPPVFYCLFFTSHTLKKWGLLVVLGHSGLNTSHNKRGQAVFITTGRKTGTTSNFGQLQSD